jgi:hypothetical protein
MAAILIGRGRRKSKENVDSPAWTTTLDGLSKRKRVEEGGGQQSTGLYSYRQAEVTPLGTVVKVIWRDDDPLGYEGGVLARVRAMAKDAVAGVHEDAVDEEAAVLRRRLRLRPLPKDDAADPRR